MGYTLFSFFLSGFVSGFNYNTHKDGDTLIQNKIKCNNPETFIFLLQLRLLECWNIGRMEKKKYDAVLQ